MTSLFISYNIAISWLYPLNCFRFKFLLRDSAYALSKALRLESSSGTQSFSLSHARDNTVVKALLRPPSSVGGEGGGYLISGLINEGLLREGGLLQILKHRCHVKIVLVQNSNNCSETFNGTAILLCVRVYICLKTNQLGRMKWIS